MEVVVFTNKANKTCAIVLLDSNNGKIIKDVRKRLWPKIAKVMPYHSKTEPIIIATCTEGVARLNVDRVIKEYLKNRRELIFRKVDMSELKRRPDHVIARS